MTLLVPPHPHPSSLRRLAAPVTNCTELAARFDAIRTDLGGVATKARPYTVTLACGGGADAFAGCQRLSTGFYAGLLTIQADAACATGAARPRLVVAALPWPDSLTPFLHHSGVRRGARASVDAHPNLGGDPSPPPWLARAVRPTFAHIPGFPCCSLINPTPATGTPGVNQRGNVVISGIVIDCANVSTALSFANMARRAAAGRCGTGAGSGIGRPLVAACTVPPPANGHSTHPPPDPRLPLT